MYPKKVFLKIKIKNLAEEARMIRFQEKKNNPGIYTWELRNHRIHDLRREQRATLLAYAFLRGKKYREIEPTAKTEPAWDRVRSMVQKYGNRSFNKEKGYFEWSASPMAELSNWILEGKNILQKS